MSFKHQFGVALAAACAVLAAGGCGSTANSRFYQLSPMSPAGDYAKGAALPGQAAVGVQVVEVAKYLDRPQIVSRLSPNRLHMAEFDRWAEPLDKNATEVIAANLRALLGSDRVVVAPRLLGLDVQYGVRIDILRMDGRPGEDVMLEARWSVAAGAAENLADVRHSRFAESGVPRSYDGLVEAESRLLGKLSEEIAQAIHASPR